MEIRLKRFLSLALAVLMVFSMMPQITLGASAASTKTIYLNAGGSGLWDQAGAWFAAWVWGSSSSNDAWYTFESAEEAGIYKIEIPADSTGMKINRMASGATAPSWTEGDSGYWNQTGDLTISSGKNLVTITGWDSTSYTWGTYTPPAVPVEYTWTVAGSAGLCGSEWSPADTANDMTKQSDGSYTKVYENVAKGTYEFKVVRDHAWGTEYPSSNYSLTVSYAKATVTITLNGTTVTAKVDCAHGEADLTTEEKQPEGCTTDGYKKVTCACGHVVSSETIAASGHFFGSDNTAARCVLCAAPNPDYEGPATYITLYYNDYCVWPTDDGYYSGSYLEDDAYTLVFLDAAQETLASYPMDWVEGYIYKAEDVNEALLTTATYVLVEDYADVYSTFMSALPTAGNMIFSYSADLEEMVWSAYPDSDYPTPENCGFSGHIYEEGTCAACGAEDPNYVAPVTYVAQIGDDKFETLQAAFDAAEDNDTVTLLTDVTIDAETRMSSGGTWYEGAFYQGDKSFTVDLNGKTITHDGAVNDYLLYFKNMGEKANEITIKNGTLTGGANVWSVLCVGAATQKQSTTVNLEGVTVNAGTNTQWGNLVVKVRGTCVVNVKSGTKIVGGSNTTYTAAPEGGAVLNVYDGAEITACAANAPAISGSGTVNIYGGAITATNGAYAVYTYSSGTPVVNISGGTVTGDVYAHVDLTLDASAIATVNISGGTVKGKLVESYYGTPSTDCSKVIVTGGIFSTDPTAYVAEGYEATEAEGTWTVRAVSKEISGTIGAGFVTKKSDDSRYYVYMEISNLYATESVVVKLYSGETLMATTTLQNQNYFEMATLGVNVVISGDASSSWSTVWEEGHPIANMAPTKSVLYVDGTEMNSAAVTIQNADKTSPYTDWAEVPGVAPVVTYVAQIGDTKFESVAEALNAADDGDTIELISGENVISMAGSVVGGKTVTITGTAIVDWTQGNLFVGRGGEGDGKVIFDGATITSSVKKNPASTGIHVSGSKASDANTNNGTLVIKNSTIELDYLINRNETTIENSSLTVYGGCYTHGRNEDESGVTGGTTANLTIDAASTVTVINENGMGVGGESNGIMTVKGTYNANVLHISSIGTVNVEGGSLNIDGTVTNNGELKFTDVNLTDATIEGTGTTRFYNNVNFYGTNVVHTTNINGTPFNLIVNKGATLDITRFVLGYDRAITVYGEIEDAHTFDPTGKTPSLKFNSTSGVSIGGTDTGALTVQDAYIELGSSSWKNSQSINTWSFKNSYVSATSFGDTKAGYTDSAEWNVTFDDSVLAASTYIKNGEGVTYNFTNGSVATANSSMTIRGELNIDETSSVTVKGYFNNVVGALGEHDGISGTVNVDGKLNIAGTGAVELIGGELKIGKSGKVELTNCTLTIDADSKLVIDGEGHAAGEYTGLVGTVVNDGTIEVINSNKTAEVVEGKIILTEKKAVAKIGDIYYETFEAAIAAACADSTITRIDILCDYTQDTIAVPGETYTMLAGQNLTIGADKAVTVTLSRTVGESFSIYLYEGNSSLTIEENVTIEGLDIIANGFATSGNNTTINGNIKALSLKQWTSNGTITVSETGSVWLGYGDGQFDLAYGNGTVTVNGNGDKTVPQFKAGYSGSRGNGNTLNLNNTYFEAGAWFTLNGSNVTVNLDNSLLAVSGGDAAGNLTIGAGNVVNVGADSEIKTGTINGAGKIVIDAAGMTAGEVTIITGTVADTLTVEVINNDTLEASIVDGKIILTEKKAVAKIGDTTYPSLQAAIDAAVDGDTVVLLEEITLTDDDIIMVGQYKVMANVEDKNITLDMNDKKITVDYTGGQYLIAVIRVADGASLTVTGNGSIDIPENGINVAYMFWKAGTTGALVIENGNYHMGDSGDSMVYTNGDEIVTIKGGTWTLDAVGTRANGFPCIFNAQGQNEKNIIITGGTFNADVNHQYYPFEAQVAKEKALKNNGDGTWTVVDAVAYVGETEGAYIHEVGYATLEEAVAAAEVGGEVTILKAGTYDVPAGKDLIITGAVDGVVFDNIGAKNMGGANVTFNNVTFNYASDSTYKGLQHSGDLVYNNCTINGQVFLYGTSETFNNCTFNTTDAANYNVWTYGAKEVAFNECTFNCAGKSVLVYNEGADHSTNLTVTDCDFIASAPVEGKAAIEIDTSPNTNGKSTVVIDGETTVTGFGTGSVSGNSLWNDKKNQANIDVYVDNVQVWPKRVAAIGETYYSSLQAAIDACTTPGNYTITLLNKYAEPLNEDVTIKQVEGVNITIDGELIAGGVTYKRKFSGTITIHGNARFEGAETLTIKNIAFVTDEAGHYFIDSNSTGSVERYAHNVTVYDCTFTATGDAVNSAVAVRIRQGYNIVIEGVSEVRRMADGLHSLFQGYGCTGVTFEKVYVNNCKNGISLGTSKNVVVQNSTLDVTGYGIRADGTGAYNTTVNGCTITAELPIVVRNNTAEGYKLTLEGTNTLTASNENGYQVIFTAGDDGTYEAPAVAVNLNGAEELSVFPAYQAQIGELSYVTLSAAIAAAEDGDTVKLLTPVTLTESITVEEAITLEGNGKTITGEDDLFLIKADMTLNGVTLVADKYSYALNIRTNDCEVVLNDCSVTGPIKGYGTSAYIIKSGVYQKGDSAFSQMLNGAVVYGGTFHYEVLAKYCAPGYVPVDNGDGTWTVKYDPACFIDADNDGVLDEGEALYGSLDTLFAADLSGEVTVVLLKNVATSSAVDTAADTTYNFVTYVDGGVTMDWNYTGGWNYIQKASIGANVTLNVPYRMCVWTDLDVYGTINTGYFYLYSGETDIHEGAVVNANTGEATTQVKNGTVLTVNGTLNTSTLNVWVGASKLVVSGENAKVTASWIDIWDGTPSVVVENGATLDVDAIKASRGGSITVDGATLTSENIELGHNGESIGTMTVAGESTVSGIKLTVVGSTVTGPEGLDVTTDIADHKVVYENGVYKVVAKVYVAQIGETKYETLADALKAAVAGDTITLLADITEDVTVSKSVTIDGAGKNYTGNISVSGTSTALIVKNVNFVDGTGYAITTNRIKSITVENCTVTNYAWGFLYANKSTPTVVVKDVTVTDVNYGVHWVYGSNATLENVKITDAGVGLLIQNHGAKKLTLKNCEIEADEALVEWNKATATDTYQIEGATKLTGAVTDEGNYAKFVLVEKDATLTAVEGLNVVTTVADHKVVYENGIYSVKELNYGKVAKIGDTYFETIDEAVAAAQAGDTIVMVNDAETAALVLFKGVTLDLNGHTVGAGGYAAIYDGNHIIDSVGGGLLKGQYVMIDDGNKALPIWDDVNKGYVFADLDNFREQITNPDENSVKYLFLPYLDAAEYDLIAKGIETSGVTMKVQASWIREDGTTGSAVFTFTDELMQQFAQLYPTANRKAFSLVLTGTAGKTITFKVTFESDTGVIFNCK